uniref:Inward rectifier potassium channel C-terminal domain-containing protein n=1 Tax=Acrobeloides nanus TaxID=290746 RepID=A0A914DJN4_9BILA
MMAGVIFAKLARPIKRAATLLFSKHAVICMRDGKLCLLFRVGDMRKSSLAEAHVRLQMIKKCVTLEGELLPFHQFDMDVGYDSGLDRVFVIWPITICHEINECSPLYEMSKDMLAHARFEIIAILEGVAESVGSTTQARTSYLPNEILWGQRFEKLVTYQRENGEYRIDFSKFHNVVDVYTPTCSAKELDDLRARGIYDENGYLLSPQLSVTDSFGNDDENKAITKNGLTQVVIQADEDDDDERRVSGIALSEMHQRRRSFLCSPSPDAELRRKQSVQVRRGPDLF